MHWPSRRVFCLQSVSLNVQSLQRRYPYILGLSRTATGRANGRWCRAAAGTVQHWSGTVAAGGDRKKSLATSPVASHPFDRCGWGAGTRLGSFPSLRGASGAPILVLLVHFGRSRGASRAGEATELKVTVSGSLRRQNSQQWTCRAGDSSGSGPRQRPEARRIKY